MAKAILDGKTAKRISNDTFAKSAEKEQAKDQSQVIVISPPKFFTASFLITGNAPYVQHNFPEKARQQMHDNITAGSVGKKGKKREGRDFQQSFESAKYKDAADGWLGIPCTQIRNGMVDACRLTGFKMTHIKQAVFIEADGHDASTHSPIVRITKGDPVYHEMPVRNANGGTDLRARPMWLPGWQALVRVKFDADCVSLTDVYNLLHRVGIQVGIGEGRPFSPKSCGLGWGTFIVSETAEETASA